MAVEFHDFSVQVKDALEDICIAFLYEAAGELESQTIDNTQQGKKYRGKLATALWKYAVNEARLEAKIGSADEAAFWEEFGTGEYALHHDGRKGWWVYVEGNDTPWPNPQQYSEQEARAVAASMRAAGLDAHATNGQKPNRPLHRAFVTLRPALIKMAEEMLGEKFK